MGELFSKVQACCISAGTELEKILVMKSSNTVTYAEFKSKKSEFTNSDTYTLLHALPKVTPSGAIISSTHTDKKRRTRQKETDALVVLSDEAEEVIVQGIEGLEDIGKKSKSKKGDLIILSPKCVEGIVVEMKDGDTFDTKKSDGELQTLKFLSEHYSNDLGVKLTFAFSCFYVSNKQQIVTGSKSRFTSEQVLTGRDLCELIGVNYDEVVQERRIDGEYNLNYFLASLLQIEDVKASLVKKLSGQ